MNNAHLPRRSFLKHSTLAATGLACAGAATTTCAQPQSAHRKASIAITLDLEMARNFPNWQDTHWDYEKGNLNDAAKQYSLAAAKRVHERGGKIHFFCVGQVLEQANVEWLKQLAADGHPIGNHTYDHVNLLAKKPEEIQFKFQRAPWLIEGKSIEEILSENIRLTTIALKERTQIDNRGFRTPGGFASGLDGREDLQRMLMSLGFTWVSSKYPAHANTEPLTEPTKPIFDSIVAAQAQSQPFIYPSGLIEIPMSPISDIGAFRNGRWKLSSFLDALRAALDWTIEHRAVFDFLAHPSCLGVVDPEMKAIDLICDLVQQSGSTAQLTDLDQIAQQFTERK